MARPISGTERVKTAGVKQQNSDTPRRDIRNKKQEKEEYARTSAGQPGISELFKFIGGQSGIAADLKEAMAYQEADALRILGIARYYFATGGSSLTGLNSYLMSRHGACDDLMYDDCPDLFKLTAQDPCIQSFYFSNRTES